MTTWADTSGLERPERRYSPWHAAAWLLGRHPQLVALVDRTGLAVDDPNDPGRPEFYVDELANAFLEHERVAVQWESYEKTRPYPGQAEGEAAYEDRLEEWSEAGPSCTTVAARALGPMSGSEVKRLRLLATLAISRVPFHIDDLSGLDDPGQQLVKDWCLLVLLS